MSTKNLKLKRTIVVLVSLALLLMPNFIVFADGADDSPTTPDTEQTTGDDQSDDGDQSGGDQSGDDGSGDDESGDDESGDDESGDDESGDDESGGDESGDDESGGDESGDDGSGDDESDGDQSGDDESGDDESGGDQSGDDESGDDESGGDQSGDDGSGDGEKDPDEEDPPLEMVPMGVDGSLQGPSMQLNGWGDKTLNFIDVTGLDHYHYSYWNQSWMWPFDWYEVSDDIYGSGSINVPKNKEVTVTAYADGQHTQNGWEIPSKSTNDPVKINMSSDKSVKAKFEGNVTYKKLTFDTADGLGSYSYDYYVGSNHYQDTVSGGTYIDVPKNTTVTVTAIAADDWHQVGWIHPDRPSNTGSVDVKLNKDKHVKASFAEDIINHTLTVHEADGLDHFTLSYGSTTEEVYVSGDSKTVTIPDGASVTATAHAQSNWTFRAWIQAPPTDRTENSSEISFTMDRNGDLSASFSQSTYTLSFQGSHCYYTVDGTSTEYRNGDTKTIDKDKSVEVTAHPDDGYYFDGWDHKPSNATGSNPITFTMNADKYVNAKIRSIDYGELRFYPELGLASYSYSWTYNGLSDSGTISSYPDSRYGNPCYKFKAPVGASISVTANSQSGYKWSYWESSPGISGNPTSLTMPSDGYIQARMEEIPTEYTLTLYKNDGLDYYTYSVDGGTAQTKYISGSSDTVTIPINKTVVLRAYAKNSHTNNGWAISPDGATSPTDDQVTFVMDGNKSAKASFSKKAKLKFHYNTGLESYSYKIDGGSEITVSPTPTSSNDTTIYVPAGKDIRVYATATSNYENDGWYSYSVYDGNHVSNTSSGSTYDFMAKFNEKAKLKFHYNTGLSSYSYKIDDGDAIAVTPTPTSYNYPTTVYVPAGKKIEVFATAASTHNNDGWYDGWIYGTYYHGKHVSYTSSGSTYDFMAKFKEKPSEYSLKLYNNDGLAYYTYSVDGGTAQTKYISGNSGTVTIPAGKPVVLRAYAKNTHSNNGWAISPEGATPALDNMVEFVMNGDKSAKASFNREYWTLKFLLSDHLDHYSYEINDGGETMATVGTEILVPVNASVKMWAYAETLYKFKTWTLGSPGNSSDHHNPESFTMTQNETAQAVFEEDGYWLYLDKYDYGISSYTVAYGSTTLTVDSSGSRLIPKNADVTVTANIVSGRAFTGWSGHTQPPTSGINKNVWVFTMDKDYSIKGNTVQLAGEKFRVTYQAMLGTGTGTVEVYYNGKNKATLSEGGHIDITYINGVNTVTVKAIASSTPNSEFVKWHNYNVTTAEMVIDLSTGQPASAKCDVTLFINVKPEFKRFGSLTVTKVDKDNTEKTLPGAKFTLSGNGITPQQKTTDDDGEAYWGDLPEGTYTLTEDSAPPGYSRPDPHQWTIKIGAYGGAYSIECTIPEKWDVTMQVENKAEHCDLTIKKVDVGGSLITEEATFKLKNEDTGAETIEKTTVNGEVEWTNLRAGEYSIIEVSAPDGYYWETQSHGISLTPNSSDGDWPYFEKEITNQECASVKVIKKDQSGNAMQGITFTLKDDQGNEIDETTTDANGEITWDNLKPGDYTVTETIPSGYYMEDPNFESFSLSNGETKTLNFKNYKYASIKVVKTNQVELPMSGVTFTLKDDQGNEIGQTVTDSSGEITWKNLKPGNYTVTETVPSGYYIEDTNPKPVSLDNGDTKTVAFMNHQYASVKVIKKDQSGNAIKGVTFTLTGPSVNIEKDTDENGEITWDNLKPGDYTVTETVPAGYYMEDDTYQTFTLDNGDEKTVNFKNYQYASVKVIKKDQSGNAMEGVTFTLKDDQGNEFRETKTDANGEITWDNLKPGDYTVTETVPAGYYMEDDTYQTFTLDNGDEKTVNFKNYEYASIKVVKGVNDQSRMPSVIFTLKGGPDEVSLTEETDINGVILWENLKKGEYEVTEVVKDGYYLTGDNPQTVILDYGDEKTVNFMNYEYVEVYAIKQDINTDAVLAGAEFAIFNYDNGTLGSQIGASQFTNGSGVARFGIEYELKANMTYWIKEVGAPWGYQNDAITAAGHAVTITEYGANNELDPVLFKNTPILQSINVVKQIEGSPAGTLLDGTKFELYVYDDSAYVYKTEATLANGTCSFDGLVPGDYKVVEVDGDTVKFFTLAADETLTLELVGEETSTTVVINNTITPAAFTLVKHDSLNAATVLSGAVYELTGMQWTGSSFAQQTFRLTTAGGGAASVSGLTPGVYTLREVSAPAGYDIDPTVYNIDIMPGRSIEETYDVADDKLGAITLAKFEQGGTVNRVDGAQFSLYRVVGGTRTLIRSGVTDVNGNILFDFLPAGDYVLVETAAPTGYNILGNGETAVTGLRVAERREVVIFNGIVIVPPPPPAAPENLIVAAPPATPTPTPTPINTDEIIIEDVDPAFGPETGEGDALFITIGILLLLGISLIIIRKKAILKDK